MVDYLLVKRNNHIFVVVYWGGGQSDLAAIAIHVRNTMYKLPGTHVVQAVLGL